MLECFSRNDAIKRFDQNTKVIRCSQVGFGPVLVAAPERGAKTDFLDQVCNTGG
jgi:hypothetical protein